VLTAVLALATIGVGIWAGFIAPPSRAAALGLAGGAPGRDQVVGAGHLRRRMRKAGTVAILVLSLALAGPALAQGKIHPDPAKPRPGFKPHQISFETPQDGVHNVFNDPDWGRCKGSVRLAHNDQFNVLFMDGHVKSLAATTPEMWEARQGLSWSWAE